MSGGLSGVGNALSGVAGLVGAAGDIYSSFQDPPEQFNTAKNPYRGLITTPQYSFGQGTLTRRNDDFLSGNRRLRSLLGTLREDVRPGFGRLTEAGVNAIRQRSAQAAGNLRTQLARRGLAGASFSDDQLQRVALEYQQAENEFRAQAFQQEMAATAELIDRESASLLSQAAQELQELNITSGFLSSVNQVAVSQAEIEKRLKQEQLMGQLGVTPEGGPAPKGPNFPGADTPKPNTPKPRPGPGPRRPRIPGMTAVA